MQIQNDGGPTCDPQALDQRPRARILWRPSWMSTRTHCPARLSCRLVALAWASPILVSKRPPLPLSVPLAFAGEAGSRAWGVHTGSKPQASLVTRQSLKEPREQPRDLGPTTKVLQKRELGSDKEVLACQAAVWLLGELKIGSRLLRESGSVFCFSHQTFLGEAERAGMSTGHGGMSMFRRSFDPKWNFCH